MNLDFPKRRVFLSDGNTHYQILSFTQNRSDSSIYISSPDFSIVKWLNITKTNTSTNFTITDSSGSGKLSVHGSGVLKITPNIQNLRFKGNFLIDPTKNVAGIRHLLTIQLAKPNYLPSSPCNNRKGDYKIISQRFNPLIIIFIAIPRVKRILVYHQVKFNNDDLPSLPPEVGHGYIDLILHSVFWFAYRTKYMDEWPNNPYICYHDGYFIPMIFGTGDKEFRIEYRNPIYELFENKLTISF